MILHMERDLWESLDIDENFKVQVIFYYKIYNNIFLYIFLRDCVLIENLV